MRDYYFTKTGVAVQTPDANSVMMIVNYVKESTNTQYLLVFTKAHIYHWNTSTNTLDTKYTLTNEADDWDYTIFNDKIIATPDNDLPLVWDATGNFTPLDTDYGVRVSYSSTSITTVDSDSSAGQKVLNVAATGDFTVGDVVIVDKDGVKEEVCKIASISAGASITMVDNLQYQHTAGDADTVHICYCVTKAKFVTEYERYLILGYPYVDQDGKWYPKALYISAIGDETDFRSTSAIGFFGIGERGMIRGFGQYQGHLFIFKNSSRVDFFPVAGNEYFNYNEIHDTFGLLAHHSIVNDDKGNLYYLATDYTIKVEGYGTISQPIQTDILNELQPDILNNVRSAFVDDYGEIMWALPIDSSQNNYIIVYKEGVWLLIKNINVTAFCETYA
jgi:hypothetical protein